jgi:hypothetical protein
LDHFLCLLISLRKLTVPIFMARQSRIRPSLTAFAVARIYL